MWKAIKRQIHVQRETFAVIAGIMLGVWVFGAAALAIAMHFIKEKVYFPLGTSCALVAIGVMMLFFVFGEVVVYFNVELSMSSTRKEFFVSHLVVCLFATAEIFVLTAVLCTVEETLNRVQCADGKTIQLLPYLFRIGIPIVALLVIVAGLVGALFLCFGRPVLAAAWIAWMFLCIGVPRIHDAAEETPDSLWGRIGNAVGRLIGGIPGYLQWILFAVVCAAGIAGTWVILRKQQVNV